MKHRLITIIALAMLVGASVAATASGAAKGRPFQFRGELIAASSTSVQLKVEGGNHAALRVLLGQSQNQTFTVGAKTEVLIWRHGIPTVGTTADLKAGDWVNVNLRDRAGSSLADLEAKPAGIVGDRVSKPTFDGKPLYLYAGTVAGPQSGGHLALHVKTGNRRALHSLLGQSADQTFSYDSETIFLLWQGKVPSVIDASKLKAGDRITVRIRAPRAATLAQVEATPANHVGDHEPGNPAAQND